MEMDSVFQFKGNGLGFSVQGNGLGLVFQGLGLGFFWITG
jgi:hypothetical protein